MERRRALVGEGLLPLHRGRDGARPRAHRPAGAAPSDAPLAPHAPLPSARARSRSAREVVCVIANGGGAAASPLARTDGPPAPGRPGLRRLGLDGSVLAD